MSVFDIKRLKELDEENLKLKNVYRYGTLREENELLVPITNEYFELFSINLKRNSNLLMIQIFKIY